MLDRGRSLRGRISYGNVVATLALFLALGGISYAAIKVPKNSVGTKQLKKNSVVSSKVKNKSLAAADFKGGQLPAGAKGSRGPTGDQGPIGPQGLPGATTSVLTGRSALNAANSSFVPSGLSTAGSDPSSRILSPGLLTKAGNLSVRLDVAPGPGNSRTFTLRLAGVGSALTCTIAGAATTCTDTGTAVEVPAGTPISLANVVGGAPAISGVQFGLTLQP